MDNDEEEEGNNDEEVGRDEGEKNGPKDVDNVSWAVGAFFFYSWLTPAEYHL